MENLLESAEGQQQTDDCFMTTFETNAGIVEHHLSL